MGFVAADDVFHAVKAVVAVQRDYGRRDDRKQVGSWPAGWLLAGGCGPRVCGLGEGGGCLCLAAAQVVLGEACTHTRALPGHHARPHPHTSVHCVVLLLLPCVAPQARLKYLISEWGMDKFRSVVEQYMGKKLQVRAGSRPVPGVRGLGAACPLALPACPPSSDQPMSAFACVCSPSGRCMPARTFSDRLCLPALP
jgi:hypothetical protein